MRQWFAGLLAAFLVSGASLAQPAAPDPAFATAKTSFEALDIEARRAIQRDLVWAGGFTGVASGEFGALTFASIRRFETAMKSSVNGTLDAAEREMLAKTATSARTKVGFRIETDKATGMRIGVPTALFTKHSANASGAERWQTADEKATLDLQTFKPEETLETLFEKGTDPKVTTRKITYKLLRPEFFVISGETASGKFYRRVERGGDSTLRGFSVGYDKAAAATIDPLVIAMASTFEGFPTARATAPQVAVSPLSTQAALGKPQRITGVVVADGKIVTSLAGILPCKTLALDGPARMMAIVDYRDAERGLVFISTATAGAKPIAPSDASVTQAVLLQRDADGKLLAAPAEISGETALAPVQEGGAGAAIFSPSGHFAGMIISEPVTKYAVLGTMPVLKHKFIAGRSIARFAGLVPVAADGAQRSSGDIAAEAGSGVVSLICRR
jgi:hypothetical protein